jgi:hypothetical protein
VEVTSSWLSRPILGQADVLLDRPMSSEPMTSSAGPRTASARPRTASACPRTAWLDGKGNAPNNHVASEIIFIRVYSRPGIRV